ncbi:MAG TPA: hypothetical protein VLZ73_04765, partial [Brevundimonas sp.]|nr:hypothetical protein [Brevundimonas sp.]
MLIDAIRAEGFRLARSRTTWFWSVLFAPLISLVFSVLGMVFMKANESKLMETANLPPEAMEVFAKAPLDLAHALTEAAGKLDSILLLPFLLIGVATLYACDYRWETWRLISARNTRPNLLLGKIAVAVALGLVAITFMLFGGVIETIVQGAVFNRPLAFEATGDLVGQFFARFGLSWLRVVQFGILALLAAVVTRSLLAALFIPMVIAVAQFFSPQLLGPIGMAPDAWTAVLLNPSAATDALKMA